MDDPETTEANLRAYLQVIARRLPWLLAVTILCIAIAFGFVATQKKQYSAASELLVQPAGGSIPGTQQTVSSTDVLTDLELIASAPVRSQVTKKVGLTPQISVAEVGATNVISVTATARAPVEAAHVADVYARTFVTYQQKNALSALTGAEQQVSREISSIEAQLQPLESETAPSAGTTSTISALANQEAVLKEQLAQLQVNGAETPGGVELVSPAVTPTSPSSPKPLRAGAIALVIGILLGVVAMFLIEYLDDKVYTKEEAERSSGGVSVLALVPRIRSWNRSRRPMLISAIDPFSPATEAYRSLRTSLQFAGLDKRFKTVLVTSASGSEGKTSTVANLSVLLAQDGERVVVVNCDLRRPRVAQFFGRSESPGFTSVLLGRDDLAGVLQPVPHVPGVTLLGAGPIPPNPTELLGSDAAADIFRQLAIDFDVVLIDSSPLLPVTDPLVLSRYADAVLLVVMSGLTSRAEVERASELLAQVNARPAGIVLNKATRRSDATSGYHYGYKYRYSSETPRSDQDGNIDDVRPVGAHERRVVS